MLLGGIVCVCIYICMLCGALASEHQAGADCRAGMVLPPMMLGVSAVRMLLRTAQPAQSAAQHRTQPVKSQ